jgi:hypothetical protein
VAKHYFGDPSRGFEDAESRKMRLYLGQTTKGSGRKPYETISDEVDQQVATEKRREFQRDLAIGAQLTGNDRYREERSKLLQEGYSPEEAEEIMKGKEPTLRGIPKEKWWDDEVGLPKI